MICAVTPLGSPTKPPQGFDEDPVSAARGSFKSGKHHDKVCCASPKLLEENKRWLRKDGWVKSQTKE